MSSKLLTLSTDGKTASVEDAKFTDIFSTAVSQTQKVTGTYGLIQSVGLVLGGMAIESKMRVGTFKPSLFGG